MATFAVTTDSDAGPGSLRAAIDLANADPSPDLIRFAIGGGGTQVIRLAEGLPAVSGPVRVDGSTQPGFAGTPLVVIDGAAPGVFGDGLTLLSGGVVVDGLALLDFRGNGISVVGGGGSVLRRNYIGVDPRTMTPAGNGGDGVFLSFASGNVIGEAGAGNVIGGNVGNGVHLATLSARNLIQGNIIGTPTTTASGIGLGLVSLRNGADGILLEAVTASTVGGTAAGAANVVSGNGSNGINIAGGSGHLVLGNLVGTDVDGAAASPNGADGISVIGSGRNTIGGPDPGSGNVISGNGGRGVTINQPASTGTLVLGNIIGLSSDGQDRVPNGRSGVVLDNAPGNTIGGRDPVGASRNLISGNGGNGVFVLGGAATGNLIQGNVIGSNDQFSSQPTLGNAFDGVAFQDAPGNTVGGTAAGAGNLILLNQGAGVHLIGAGSHGIVVQGNRIGTNLSADPFLGNFSSGVNIQSAPGNLIGGTEPGAGNTIVSSQIDAIDIQSTDADEDGNPILADRNVVQGNSLGLAIDLTDGEQVVLQNVNNGLFIVAAHNTIGGTASGAGNVISQNNSIGITIGSLNSPVGVIQAVGNVIQGNKIGLDRTGTRQAGNGRTGIQLIGAIDTLIGGTEPGAGNVISGNTIGLEIFAPLQGQPNVPLNAVIQGNIIGLGADGFQLAPLASGDSSLGNTGDGIVIGQAAMGVTVGGAVPGAGNVISGNGSSGVRIASASSGNLIQGNTIGLARDGRAVRGNNQSGVFIAEGSARNTIGGTAAGAGNVIAGNSVGVTITNAGTVNNLILGNNVGLAADGTTPIGNIAYGFLLLSGASSNTIGGPSPAARNVISANGQGIAIIGPDASGNAIQGNYIGTDASGSIARGNLRLGISLNASANNTIGGNEPGAGNLISGNTGVGVLLSGMGSTGNLVAGNLVGTDATGTRDVDPAGQPLGNSIYGIQVDNAPRNTIGGDTPAGRNVISGNRQAGVEINGIGSFGAVVRGNLIGTDASGLFGLGNAADGILIDNAPGVVIGGVTGREANIISGNVGNGIQVVGIGSVFDAIVGNLIGTTASGGGRLGNGLSGVLVNGAPGVTIGGTIASLRNVISANDQNGVRVAGADSAGTVILGNLIGTDASGQAGLGNFNDGVLLDGARFVTVGGTAPGSTNVISANGSSGVEFGGVATFFNVVQGNLIGTDSSGAFALANPGVGDRQAIGVFANNAPFNLVGGSAPFSGNLISGHSGAGVFVFGVGAQANIVQGNRIGTDLSGQSPLPNQAGVFINEASANLIGGQAVGAGNLISGNQAGGVILQGTGATRNVIQGNLIGTDIGGSRAITPATGGTPQQSGVLIVDAPSNVVGGDVATARNVVSGNVVGVVISGFNAQGNLVLGNAIGTDIAGRLAVANTVGVYINGSAANTIGGSTPGSGNLVSGNTSTAITLFGPQTTRNLVAGNLIGTDLAGTAALPNQQGIYVESAPSNTIGGATPAAGNLISGNAVAGVYLFGGSAGNLIQGNRIGTAVSGRALGNRQYGVLLFNASNNVVDRSAATGNRIANSGIGNFREFTGPAPSSSASRRTAARRVVAKAAHPTGPRSSSRR